MTPHLKSKKIKQFTPLKFEKNNTPKPEAKKKKIPSFKFEENNSLPMVVKN